MSRPTETITVCLHPCLLRRIEQFRKQAMRKGGFVSRSNIVRWLLDAGLTAAGGRATELPEDHHPPSETLEI